MADHGYFSQIWNQVRAAAQPDDLVGNKFHIGIEMQGASMSHQRRMLAVGTTVELPAGIHGRRFGIIIRRRSQGTTRGYLIRDSTPGPFGYVDTWFDEGLVSQFPVVDMPRSTNLDDVLTFLGRS